MMKNIIIAWRNLWRKPWRTVITSGSIFFGVLLSAFMTSMQYGSYESMISNVVKFYSGYMQIFIQDYHENKTINNTFVLTDSLITIIDNEKAITQYTKRLEYFSLASSDDLTKGSVIIGVDPEGENNVTGLKKWVKEGSYLNNDVQGVLVAIELAKYLKIGIGDTIVLYGQGFHGVMAAGVYPVSGILEFPSPELNKQFIYMTLQASQKLFSAPDRLSSLVLMVEDNYQLPSALRHLKEEIKPPMMIMSWQELQPALVQMIDGDKAGGLFMKSLLYLIITFGILGTILMMVSERKRELGVMIAIGMQRARLGTILFFETLFIGIIGATAGILVSIPITYWYYLNPIPLTGDAAKTMIDMGIEPFMYFSIQPDVYYVQAIVVLIITMAISIYPIIKSFTLKLTSALRA
ncbi:MAG: ABC transporter permease [Bacteroidetes bacterium]|jgi:ABC-type lipoprotein release transport system permease subunit|nr:ABC transporter permease [Bacteroidota bacterium]|tara:strand:+ start:2686 stop:3906 length:1221 start_codon:yes stop_codon:yes gene_type:complete